MIETLLPEANFNEKNQGKHKMIELWSDNTPRKGWIKIF